MENINTILKEKGITKQLLAQKMDMTRENLYRILNANPTLDNIKKVANALEVEIWELFKPSENELTGFIEFKGQIYRIQSKSDLENLLSLID